MRVNLDWLKEWTEFDLGADRVADTLTIAGLEVDSVTATGAVSEQIRVAEVVNLRAHPNADKLSIATASLGRETHEVVCGAPNVAIGISSPDGPHS